MNCDRKPSGGSLSYDEMEEQYGYGCVTDSGAYKQVNESLYEASAADVDSDAMLLEMLWERVAELTEENQIIVKMFSEGASDQEIADAVGMSRTGLNYRKNQILKNLKNIFSDFRQNG